MDPIGTLYEPTVKNLCCAIKNLSYALYQRIPTFFCSRTPKQNRYNSRTPEWALVLCFNENLSVILKQMIIWRTPWDFLFTPGGTCTPGWKPLLYIIIFENIIPKNAAL